MVDMNHNIAAIILAGGSGTRFHQKKQFIEFRGKALWRHVYDKIASVLPSENIVVVGVGVSGGSTRSESVTNGLNTFNREFDRVIILEAARPLVTEKQIAELIESLSPSVTFVAPCVDTIIKTDKSYLKRSECLRLLTPQAFDYRLLREAYKTGKYLDMTDETSVFYEEYGIQPTFLEGGENLFKVTYPKDITVINELYNEMTKRVLITGGNGDIAKAIAKLLEEEGGYEIFMPSKEILDVTKYDQIEKVITDFKPDILINNAGYVVPYGIAENQYLSEQKAININLLGTFWCTGVATNLNRECLIINIGSSAATKVHADWSSYCAAKAGVVMASQCWAAEGIKVKCISPGRTQSKMRKSLFPNEDQNTLLRSEDFAFIVLKAIKGSYNYGENINVNIDNINELKNGK